jgi:hypothetical protein
MRYVKSNSNVSVMSRPATISKFIYERILALGITLTHSPVNLYLDSEDVYLLQAYHDDFEMWLALCSIYSYPLP